MKHTTLNVRGMSCGHCEAAVEGELNSIRGVRALERKFRAGHGRGALRRGPGHDGGSRGRRRRGRLPGDGLRGGLRVKEGTPLNRLSFSATLHCLTGCAIGEVLGLVIGTALGWGNVATIALAVA